MLELIEKTILTAMGAVSLSQKKAEELLQDIKERFNVTEEEGKAILEKIQTTAKENQEKLQDLAQEEVHKALDRFGVVSKKEYEALLQRVKELENKLKEAGK